jgi:RHH-type transcriptional regulator, proline utilization regulon repressor / proline dehydrogenase / delta 1-pyrroline-5-carboxylate dehydrogenase
MLEMIRGGLAALTIGDPRDLATDVGPVIDEARTNGSKRTSPLAKRAGWRVSRLPLPPAAAKGCFVAPTIIESALDPRAGGRAFRPDPAHRALPVGGAGTGGRRYQRDRLRPHAGLAQPHRRHARFVKARAKVGNFYVNRNQIGAVVESQPFGGEGLSGTGPKAGGPHYLARFATERVMTIDTTAAGGNASLLAAG